MKSTSVILFAGLMAGCASTSTPSPEAAFKQADTDGDGSVGRKESTELIIADAFALFDANGDGFVDEAEFQASGGTSKRFREINRSGTGAMTLEEAKSSPLVFNTFVVGFDEADVDKDGKVTYAEYLAYLERRDAAVR